MPAAATVSAGGTDHGAQLSRGAQIDSGIASDVTVYAHGTESLASGAITLSTTISSGGTEIVSSGGTSISGILRSGATLDIVLG